jgi:hypothetical protein
MYLGASDMVSYIAAIVAFIAFLQWVTARQKVVLDLFDKRFALYEELRGVIGRHVTHGVTSVEDTQKFTLAASRAQFLFGPEITSYLEERRIDLSRASFEHMHPPGPLPEERRKAREDDHVARLDRLSNFYRDFDMLVAPYMKHTQKRFPIPYIDS